MPKSEGFEIICYLGWFGADAAYRFDTKERYERARKFLDELSANRVGADCPAASVRSRKDFYFVDSADREAFYAFVQSTASAAE